jgi:hypothetical protein
LLRPEAGNTLATGGGNPRPGQGGAGGAGAGGGGGAQGAGGLGGANV